MWQHCCLQSVYEGGQWIKLGFFWPLLHRPYNLLPPGKYSRLLSCAAFRFSRKNCLRRVTQVCPLSSLAVIHKFDYVFAENGTVQYKDGRLLSRHVSDCAEPRFSHFYFTPHQGIRATHRKLGLQFFLLFFFVFLKLFKMQVAAAASWVYNAKAGQKKKKRRCTCQDG